MAENVAVIGDGGMGTISAIMLAENGLHVRLWSAFPEQARKVAADRENRRFLPGAKLPGGVHPTGDDAEAMDGAAWIVAAVPTQYIRSVFERLGPHLPATVPICSVAKGIEVDTLLRPSQVIREVLGNSDRALGVLSGPSIAPEIARRLPALVTAASEDPVFVQRVQHSFSRPYFRVYTNDDVLGVEIAGATKNVIAIAAGIIDGLEYGANAKAALVTRGIVEIQRLGECLGARPETFAGLSGLGDLVTTCTSPVGRNRSFGEAIGKGMNVDQARKAIGASEKGMVVEGLATTAAVVAMAGRYGVEMPITSAVHRVLSEGTDPADVIGNLMTRPLKAELPGMQE